MLIMFPKGRLPVPIITLLIMSRPRCQLFIFELLIFLEPVLHIHSAMFDFDRFISEIVTGARQDIFYGFVYLVVPEGDVVVGERQDVVGQVVFTRTWQVVRVVVGA